VEAHDGGGGVEMLVVDGMGLVRPDHNHVRSRQSTVGD